MLRLKPPPSWPFEPSACSTVWVSQPAPVFLTAKPAGMGRPQSLACTSKRSVRGVSIERGRWPDARRRLLLREANFLHEELDTHHKSLGIDR